MVQQCEIELRLYRCGFHLITHEALNLLPGLPELCVWRLFIKHTSTGLTIYKNADPSLMHDFEQIFNRIVSKNQLFYTHITEGNDDFCIAAIYPYLRVDILNGETRG